MIQEPFVDAVVVEVDTTHQPIAQNHQIREYYVIQREKMLNWLFHLVFGAVAIIGFFALLIFFNFGFLSVIACLLWTAFVCPFLYLAARIWIVTWVINHL